MLGLHDHPSVGSAEEAKHILERELKRPCRIVLRMTARGLEYRVILKETMLPKGWEEMDSE